MAQVSYALREDPNSIVMLQDAGKRYDKYCQIATFGRNILRPEFFRQYLCFAPFLGANGKYHGTVTDVQISIEDNGYLPMSNYVAMIDSEVEFKVTPSVIRQLSRDHMPAWGIKSYLDYFSDRKSGILLFLRVYRIKQKVSPTYLEKGGRGSTQVFKLYNEQGEEASLFVDIIEPVLSDNKFSYLKDEILHLLKVENAFIALYDDTETGLNNLQERIIAERQIQGFKERWKGRHSQFDYTESDEDSDVDMAQLDYESIYNQVLSIAPGMKNIIEYVRTIQAARLGEYDFYLKDIHTHTTNEANSFKRLFDMSLRAAVKDALYYHNRHNADLEDAFQEACLGVISAINKHNDNVAGLFPSYVAMWIRQILSRDLPLYDYNVRIPIHYASRIAQLLKQISPIQDGSDCLEIGHTELYNAFLQIADCNEQEAYRLAYILSPAESIEEIIINPQKEEWLSDDRYDSNSDTMVESLYQKNLQSATEEALSILSEREALIIRMRFGIGYDKPCTLEEIGSHLSVTRERVRQIEQKAMQKIARHRVFQMHTAKQLKAVLEETKENKTPVEKKPKRKRRKDTTASLSKGKEKQVIEKKKKRRVPQEELLIPGYSEKDSEIINIETGQIIYDAPLKNVSLSHRDYEELIRRGFMFVSDFIDLPRKGVLFDPLLCGRVEKAIFSYLRNMERIISQKEKQSIAKQKRKETEQKATTNTNTSSAFDASKQSEEMGTYFYWNYDTKRWERYDE